MSFLTMIAMLSQPVALPEEFYEPRLSEAVTALARPIEGGDTDEYIAALEALSKNGDDSASELLGELFSFGRFGIAPDRTRACRYFDKIGERRPDGLHNQAFCHESGDAGKVDLIKARALYRKAAEAGWLQSVCAYGNMLIKGRGGEADVEEGATPVQAGIDSGRCQCTDRLRWLFAFGQNNQKRSRCSALYV